jgi:uncharacterized protein (TIGR02453 family)
MIHPDTLPFLSDLALNNTKEWFDENRNRYQTVRKQFSQFISVLINRLAAMDPAIGLPEAKDCIFRINRDIRFSPDKSPYKTNMGAYIARGGRRNFNPGYYIHIEPGTCFAAGGMYIPPAPALKAIREEIMYDPSAFRSIIENPAFSKSFGEIHGEKLKTSPQGYDKNDPDVELIRYKSYTVFKEIPDQIVKGDQYLGHLMGIYEMVKPFNDFLNRAIQDISY